MVECRTHQKLQSGVLFSWSIFHGEGNTHVAKKLGMLKKSIVIDYNR